MNAFISEQPAGCGWWSLICETTEVWHGAHSCLFLVTHDGVEGARVAPGGQCSPLCNMCGSSSFVTLVKIGLCPGKQDLNHFYLHSPSYSDY